MSKSPRERALSLLSDFATAVRTDNDALAQAFTGRIVDQYVQIDSKQDRERVDFTIMQEMGKFTEQKQIDRFEQLIVNISNKMDTASATMAVSTTIESTPTYSAFPTGAHINRQAPSTKVEAGNVVTPTSLTTPGQPSPTSSSSSSPMGVTPNYDSFPTGAHLGRQKNPTSADPVDHKTPGEKPKTLITRFVQKIKQLRHPKEVTSNINETSNSPKQKE